MLSKSRALIRRPLWNITSYRNERTELLTIDAGVEGCFLAVFSFKEEGEVFLHLLVKLGRRRNGKASRRSRES
jgi:hypothetical protein